MEVNLSCGKHYKIHRRYNEFLQLQETLRKLEVSTLRKLDTSVLENSIRVLPSIHKLLVNKRKVDLVYFLNSILDVARNNELGLAQRVFLEFLKVPSHLAGHEMQSIHGEPYKIKDVLQEREAVHVPSSNNLDGW